MSIDTLIVLLIVCASLVGILLVSAPGERFIKALKRLMGAGDHKRKKNDV